MRGIKLLLESLGIRINPDEIEVAWNQTKNALPQLAKDFNDLSERMKRVDERMKCVEEKIECAIILLRCLVDSRHDSEQEITSGN